MSAICLLAVFGGVLIGMGGLAAYVLLHSMNEDHR